MAQSPGSTPSSSGGKGGNTSGTNGKGSRTSSKGSAKGQSRITSKKSPIEVLANHVPSHHAHHGMAGEYTTKGKFANMPDGNMAFED
jgi:hypothetical protein